jgi:hypothetical protein
MHGLIDFLLVRQSFPTALQVALRFRDFPGTSRRIEHSYRSQTAFRAISYEGKWDEANYPIACAGAACGFAGPKTVSFDTGSGTIVAAVNGVFSLSALLL